MIRLLLICIAGLLLPCCRPAGPVSKAPEPPSGVLARVGSVDITASDFTVLAAERRCPDTPEARAALLDEMIDEEALVQRARATGLDQTPAFRQAMRRYLTARLDEQELQPLLTSAESISETELDAACREAAPRFTTPAARRCAWLRIDSDAAGKEAATARLREAAEKFRSLPADPARIGFGTVAAEFSDDTDTRYQGGDIGWHNPAALPAFIPSEVATQPEGQLTEPHEVPGGLAIFLTTGTRSASTLAPEALRSKVSGELIASRRAAAAKDWKAGLREDAKANILRQPPSVPSSNSVGSDSAPPQQ